MEPSNIAPLGYEELESRANLIITGQEKFNRNIYWQQTEVDQLRRSWWHLSETNQKFALQKYALLFPRCRREDRPQDCLRKIIELTESKDVYRALRVGENTIVDFIISPGDDVFPTTGWFGRYLDHARWNEVPLALHFWASLAILAVACRRNYYQDINTSFLWMNQYILLTGPKGNGKSAAKDIAESMLVRMNRKMAERQDRKELNNALSFQPQILPEDITPQALVEQLSLMSDTPRFLDPHGSVVRKVDGEAVAILISDEFSNTAGKGTHSASLFIPLLTKLAFSDNYTKATKMDGKQIVERIALSMLACTQPGWMRNTIVSDALAGGFVERANFIYRPAPTRAIGPYSTPTIDPLVTEDLAEFLTDVAYQPSEPQILMPTDEAKKFVDSWYVHEHGKGPRDALDDAIHTLHRRQIHVIRMASMLAVSEQDSIPWVEEKHYRQAIRIIEAEEDYYMEFISQASRSTEAAMCDQVLAWLGANGGCMPKRRFGNTKPFNNWTGKVRGQVIDSLRDSYLIDQASGKGGLWWRLPGSPWSGESDCG